MEWLLLGGVLSVGFLSQAHDIVHMQKHITLWYGSLGHKICNFMAYAYIP